MSCEGCRAIVGSEYTPEIAGCLADTRDIEAFVDRWTDRSAHVAWHKDDWYEESPVLRAFIHVLAEAI